MSLVFNHSMECIAYFYRNKKGTIPPILSSFLSEATLKKTILYENVRYAFFIPKNLSFAIIEISLLLGGFYPFVFEYACSLSGNIYIIILLFMFFVSIPSFVISIPFSLFKEFSIEKSFGFSTMSLKMWIIDQVKSLIVSVFIGIPLFLLAVFILEKTQELWWLWLSCGFLVLMIAMIVIYPLFIAPLFNRFTPLEDGELKDRLECLLKKAGFKADGLFVMDASKRSKHSNAYFTGFGKSKRVVLFDTLIEQLSVDEIEAVLAHELGHYTLHHIKKQFSVRIPLIIIFLYVLSLFIVDPTLYAGFGFNMSNQMIPHVQAIGLFLLFLLCDGFSTIFSIFGNIYSRKCEFEADAFALTVYGENNTVCARSALGSALIKLHTENLTEVSVSPIYSFCMYSHPPLLERLTAIGFTGVEKNEA